MKNRFLSRWVDPIPDDPFYQPRKPLWLPEGMAKPPRLNESLAAGNVRKRYALLINPFYPKSPHGSFGKHVLTPTLALTSIAGATPTDWQVRYWDENLLQGPPPGDPLPEVVGITVHLTFARRACELARWYRARGSKVVFGGLHVLSCPEELAPHADALVNGDGVQLWPEILQDIAAGTLKPRYHATFERPYQLDPPPRRDVTDENLSLARKRTPKADDYARRVRILHDHGIQVNGSFVVGFDGDRKESFSNLAHWIESNRLECATFHILTPYPGTPLFRQLEAEGRLLHRNWDLYDTAHVVFQPKQMTPEELLLGYDWLYRRLFSHASIWRRRPATLSALPTYLAGCYLYKRSNRLWHFLIKHRLVRRIWRPLVEITRLRHVAFRKRLARQPEQNRHLEASISTAGAPGSIMPAGV